MTTLTRERTTASKPTPQASKKDGRFERSARTHRAIIAALLDLVDQGTLEPTAAEIAERAGVALRSIRQHFASREALFLAAVEAHAVRVTPERDAIDASMTLPERIAAFAEVRARDLELSSPLRRATGLLERTTPARSSSAVSKAVDSAWQRRRREASHVFAAELAKHEDPNALLDAVDLVAHGRTWDTMRVALGLSRTASTATLRRCLGALLRSE